MWPWTVTRGCANPGVALRRETGCRLKKAHYKQLRARGKLAKVALVACMRKLLTIVNARRRDELLLEAATPA